MKFIRYQTTPVFTPAANFFGLRNEMDRLFNTAFSSRSEFPVDLYETDNAFVVRAELPGFRKEDMNVEVADGQLTITAQQKTTQAVEGEKENTAPDQERRVTRTVSIPEKAQMDGIQAEYENGVLTVTLPRQEETKPRQVTINVK